MLYWKILTKIQNNKWKLYIDKVLSKKKLAHLYFTLSYKSVITLATKTDPLYYFRKQDHSASSNSLV